MATLKNGIFGGFSGKVGGVVGSAQLEQQAKFTLLVNFLKPVTPILNKAFEKSNFPMTALNKALSNNQNAVTGMYPDFKIDYTKVILCKGYIRNGEVVQVMTHSDGKLILSLNKTSLYSIAAIWTLFFIAAYEEESGRWIYKMNPESTRDQSYELDLNPFRSKSFHIYSGFMPATGASTISLYSGLITVQ